jgi:transcriptional regulator with XRE-family HTH domain
VAEVDKAIGERLRRIRKSRRMGQMELAQLSGVAQGGISAIELGKREAYPSTLERLAAALDVPTSAFFEDGRSGGPPPRPRTPLTDEKEEHFDKRFAATDATSAEKLQEKVSAELDELRQYVEQLKAAKLGDDDFRLKSARVRLVEAKRRTLAITSRATDLALNAEFGRDKPVFDTVEAYVGAALEVDAEHGEEQARHDSAQRVEHSGEAG